MNATPTVKMIRSPIVFKKKMLDAKHDYEVDMERAGWSEYHFHEAST